ncbi:hypothetical protein JOE57_002927 [Microlunatus panaciterrae]|uniref:FAD-binding PCMH-type domain-containing protein n=1 Tax=Microlunatus panaciterrae TaxID=400768 RepID=A0ABS2RLW5_9ACTN|nr:FAD-binding oxidoreductase [Microlunatus panaciterrae]MBM7800006.1 hypothetical protein [Microlunatus panaciterrae]
MSITQDQTTRQDISLDREVREAAVSLESQSPVSSDRHTDPALRGLAGRLRGRLATAADPDWDQARSAWNLAVDQRPVAVAFPADAGDVAQVIGYAAEHGLRVAPQSGGHNPAPLGDLSGTILLRTTLLKDIVVDPQAHRVRAGAGALWGEVNAALAGHGLGALSGSSPDVGIAGYTLSGGYSWLGRRHGLAVNHVLGAEVVTGDGRILEVDADTEPELFWALRGGGGNGAVVTRLDFRVFPIDQVYAGSLLFPIDRAREVFTAFETWTRDLDEAVTACARLLRLPPLPELPDFLRGQSFAVVDGAILGSEESAHQLLEPLRALGPTVDLFGVMPATQLAQIHMDPPAPTPAAGGGVIINDMSAETIEAILAVAGPEADTSLLAVDVRLLGGALGRPVQDGGAVDHLPGRFLVFGVGVTPNADLHALVEADVRSLLRGLGPWRNDRTYANFSESSEPASRFHSPEVLARLVAVQEAVDPDQIIRANHPLR